MTASPDIALRQARSHAAGPPGSARPQLDPASYRDPAGFVYHDGGRVFRAIRPPAIDDYLRLRASGLLDRLISKGWMIPTTQIDAPPELGDDVAAVVEHQRIPIVSYPYEWGFEALKAAAQLHLDVHLEALEAGFTLSDGSAYNIQFRGPHPVFIDLLSFRRYEDGAYWDGHRQFCEHFLNPLLLRAAFNVPHNDYFKGSMEGLPSDLMARLLPLRWKLRWTVFGNVVLPAWFQGRARIDRDRPAATARGLSREGLTGMLQQLRAFVAHLSPRGAAGTWSDYTDTNTYSDASYAAKLAFVERLVTKKTPNTVLDLGSNTGDFSVAALRAGARLAIGLEGDPGALDLAFKRARTEGLAFLPLHQDLVNPSASQGWNGRERLALADRIAADAVLALAVLHHMVLARNVPLAWALDWIVGLAPTGIVEFVPPDDPMARQLLGGRDPRAFDYSEEAFVRHLSQRATIAETLSLPGGTRRLFAFERRTDGEVSGDLASPWRR